MPPLLIREMHERHYGLSVAVAASHSEAAAVCLSRHHDPPTDFTVEDKHVPQTAQVEWKAPDLRTLGAWNNATDATEAGAYACAIAAVDCARGYRAVRRAETGTGADYYVGPEGTGVEDLEECLRLEVSGSDTGDEKALRGRLAGKIRQARAGTSSLPAIAAVVGFQQKLILLADA